MFWTSVPVLCYYYPGISEVLSFFIDKQSSDKLIAYWLFTLQAKAQDFKFPLVVF